jgi:hypothetical protein
MALATFKRDIATSHGTGMTGETLTPQHHTAAQAFVHHPRCRTHENREWSQKSRQFSPLTTTSAVCYLKKIHFLQTRHDVMARGPATMLPEAHTKLKRIAHCVES